MRLALAQINSVVGGLDENRDVILKSLAAAKDAGADVVCFPELALTGYPPEDLLLKRGFIEDNQRALNALAAEIEGIVAIVGFVDSDGPMSIFNAAAIVADQQVRGIYRKQILPNYGVFDEERYFKPGKSILLAEFNRGLFGVTICEDIWSADGPHSDCAKAGASLVINLNASPYHVGKGRKRQELVRERAMENDITIAYVNLVGGQDELVFDGSSFVCDHRGELLARAAQFQEELLVLDIELPEDAPKDKAPPEGRIADLGVSKDPERSSVRAAIAAELDEDAEVYQALVLGVRDYIGKNGFDKVLIGLSGGIDSALTAAIAVDALGPRSVLGISNPSEFTSGQSMRDATKLADNLGIRLETLPIKLAFEVITETLARMFRKTEIGLAEENVQARIRGLLWMAVSNKTGRMVLSTGNKSELSVGYATLYGDMAGGFAVLKDVPKTLVYKLARFRNQHGRAIPESIIDRPPTAELRPDQLDTDSLPPYDVLDPILEAYVEQDLSGKQIVALGFDPETVGRVIEMVDKAEYKRRQAAPGIKITQRAFGKDRRLPITNHYKQY
ncbi:MAG: NAD+ synthase [Actinomycetota bacterium]